VSTNNAGLRRIQRGRGHVYDVDGVRVPGVTTITDSLAKPALVGWAAKTVAGVAIDRWDELVPLKPSERFELLRTAAWEDRNTMAVRGQDVHAALHALQTDPAGVVEREELVPFLDAYDRFDGEWKPREILVEAVVGSRAFRYCGTCDLVADLADGARWLLDWKTGGSGIYPEVALQLAGYRYAEVALDADGNETPMPAVDRCGALWLRDDGSYDLYPVEVDEGTFELFVYLRQLHDFQKAERGTVIGDVLAPPVPNEEVAP
jgi:hypothetical protein